MHKMEKIRIRKGSVEETLLIPLYGRKMCTQRFPELYSDPKAVELCEKLDYDFSSLDKKANSTVYQFGALEAAMRQLDMTWEIRDYLKKHPKASIVNMGCGLDETGRYCSNGLGKIYDLDMPDTIDARKALTSPLENEELIGTDLTDHAWMDRIDGTDGAVYFAAGVFHYLTLRQAKDLVLDIAGRFPGSRILFDTVGKFGRNVMMKTVLRNMDFKDDVSHYLYVEDVRKDLGNWSEKLTVSSRPYMLGYHDMRSPGVKGIHRFLARVADKTMKMQIIRMDVREDGKEAER